MTRCQLYSNGEVTAAKKLRNHIVKVNRAAEKAYVRDISTEEQSSESTLWLMSGIVQISLKSKVPIQYPKEQILSLVKGRVVTLVFFTFGKLALDSQKIIK
jgi:hypothetical protein